MKKSYWQREVASIGQGCLTNSKHPDRFIKPFYPTHVTSGRGCFLTDETGRQLTDYICGLGTNLLGYDSVVTSRAIAEGLGKGLCHSLPTHYEIESAEILKEMFPFVEKFKFLNGGTDAAVASLRMARSYTDRSLVLSEGYHGWADIFTSLTPPASGVVDHFFIEKFHISKVNEGVAAVIVEPISLDTSIERINLLRELRDRCTKNGVVLIFDEIITGFRYLDFSVSKHYGIHPDLILIGKAMGNGVPISAVAGHKDLLDADYFVSATYAGNALGHNAAKATARALLSNDCYKIKDLWRAGEIFQKRFNSFSSLIKLVGYGTRAAFEGPNKIKAMFWQECIKAGILFGASWFISFPHIELNDSITHSLEDILAKIGRGEVQLEGEMPSSPFSARARDVKKD